ncbi:MAG TPA: S8 family serine peptidase [Bradyrhizobium sp.]|jgi:subtilisin family serine protease
MVHDRANRRVKAIGSALASVLTLTVLLCWGASEAVHAQAMMRGPNLNIGPRINPNITGRVITNVDRFPRTPRCGDPDRPGCTPQPSSSTDGGSDRYVLKQQVKRDVPLRLLTGLNQQTIANQLVAEIDGSLSSAQAGELARRHGLVLLQSQNFPLISSTVVLFRVTNRRSIDAAGRDLATAAGIRSVQPNFRYTLQEQVAPPKGDKSDKGDLSGYVLEKLRLPQAHTLADGANVRVAVIDSGIDIRHPELAGSILASWDALDSKEGPHFHGTGVAGAIAAHGQLMGSAPAAKIIAIRAFGVVQNSAESSSFIILRSLDYAASQRAQIVNMSFAGPKDALIERGVAAMAAHGIVMIAAAGNAGPKSPPLYPAANSNVIAVSGTDAQDRLFSASNRGNYIAVSAPGDHIPLAVPDAKYDVKSGTSFSGAFVSGIAALLLQRDPSLKPDDVRAILTKTARDLGTPGRDDLFGAGEADAYAAVSAVVATRSVPLASSAGPAKETAPEQKTLDQKGLDASLSRALAADRSPPGEANRPAAQ